MSLGVSKSPGLSNDNVPQDGFSYEDSITFLELLDSSVQKLGLERVRMILNTLGNPQDALPMVHITGTNGKGSVSAMVNSILASAGFRVGMFTSPHLVDVRERIVLNGRLISQDAFADVFNRLKQHLVDINLARDEWPTYFEWLNIQAYQYFLDQKVDLSIFEVGLGGRLDSTNVVNSPCVTVVTGIGMDHAHILGDTVAKIAAEKAGILKENVPLVLGPSIPPEARDVILKRAASLNVPVCEASKESLSVLKESQLDDGLLLSDSKRNLRYNVALRAPYQLENVATALAVIDCLKQQGWRIDPSHIQSGLAQVQWPARFQVLPGHRLIVDGSHNPQGFESLLEAIRFYLPNRPIFWLCSLQNNRPLEPLVDTILKVPGTQSVIWSRAMDGADRYHLPGDAVKTFGGQVRSNAVDELPEAFEMLQLRLAQTPEAYGIVTGSLYTAGDTLALLLASS